MQTLRLDSISLERFCPAGSLSSHRDSRSESEDEQSHPAPLLLSPAAAFLPTSDNVIAFEVYTPAEDSLSAEDHQKPTLKLEIEKRERSTMTEKVGLSGRYERQNAELRRELQSCTSDLLELDKAKSRLATQLHTSQVQLQVYEQAFHHLSSLFSRLLDEETAPTSPEIHTNISDLAIHKAEILASRYVRLQAGYDRLAEDNTKLRLDQDGGPQVEIVRQLNSRIKLKDRCIQKLEQTLQIYKEKLTQIRDQDEFPSNKTENFSMRLQGLNTDSPAASPPTFPETSITPCEKLESEEDVPRTVTGESLNNTLDKGKKVNVVRKREHVRTQSQGLIEVEKYQPVLMNRSRETSFRSRPASKPAPLKLDTPKQPIKPSSVDRRLLLRKVRPSK